MNETLDYIESYFINTLAADERLRFEQRIQIDAAFAREVAFYLQTRQVLRQEVLVEKEKSWQTGATTVQQAPVIAMKKPSPIKRWMVAAAVLLVLLATSLGLLLGGGNARQLASDYLQSPEVYSNLMDASQDSLQQGIAALKMDSLDKAEALITNYAAAHPTALRALKFSGVVALRQEKYTEALARFDQLSGIQHYDNMGPFFKALTLLLRNEKGDKEQARELLAQVIKDPALGNKNEAKKLLDKL